MTELLQYDDNRKEHGSSKIQEYLHNLLFYLK